MKVLDFTNKTFEPIELGRNTAMIMCFTPKIILFETEEELYKFGAVWELLTDFVWSNENGDDEELQEGIGQDVEWYSDIFLEESWYITDEGKRGRNLRVVPYPESDEMFEDTIAIKFGVLNSKDCWTPMEVLENHIALIHLLFDTEELRSKCKDDTLDMLKTIVSIWEEDVKLSERHDREYFKVMVEND